ncbi:hypothetical protein GJ496_010646 [Pomphorhynchus laevis]|nr:hypothetical protein GJ496_010646 [Pomphorhynchus laevis]
MTDVESLSSNLRRYKTQLEQVEIALSEDPENAELGKLKRDIEEVIKITEELLGDDAGQEAVEDRPVRPSLGPKPAIATNQAIRRLLHKWKQGDKCLAIWSGDNEYYQAALDEVLPDGSCTVIFDGYTTTECTSLASLKPCDGKAKTFPGIKNRLRLKREQEARAREAKKRKLEKRMQKLKEIDTAREREKNRWSDFNRKLSSKTWKGVVSKSIAHNAKPIQVKVKGSFGQPGRYKPILPSISDPQ